MPAAFRRPARATCLVLLALVLVASGSLPTPARGAAAGPEPIVKVREIAPGLTLTRIIDKRLPRRTFVLTADLSFPITFDTILAGQTLGTRAKTSAIANRGGAIAAINGDFGSFSGWTTHPFAADGSLVRLSRQLGTLFAVSTDEQHVFVDRPSPSVTVTDTTTGNVLEVDHWNGGDPLPGEIGGYSPVGGTLVPPPDHACSAHLAPTGPPTVAAPDGVDQGYLVNAVACQEAPMAVDGGVVISAPAATDEAIELLALSVGAPIQLHWTLGWQGVFDAIGGTPLLVADGQIVVERGCAGYLCRGHPRTGIGVTADGKIVLVVVDGRQPKWSAGPALYGFARIMQQQGAIFALNLDGGGSSTMVVEDEVVNHPSEGHQRKVSSAVLILPGPDPGEGS